MTTNHSDDQWNPLTDGKFWATQGAVMAPLMAVVFAPMAAIPLAVGGYAVWREVMKPEDSAE